MEFSGNNNFAFTTFLGTECKKLFPVKFLYLQGKGKATPLQALIGPERSRKLKLPDFKTISR